MSNDFWFGVLVGVISSALIVMLTRGVRLWAGRALASAHQRPR